MLEQLVEDERFFDFGGEELSSEEQTKKIADLEEFVTLELTQSEFRNYTTFCERINRHLEESGYRNFKSNHFFSHEYFQGFSDDQIMEHYKIAEYLHSEVLKQSLNWYLGGLFKDMTLEAVENLYLEPEVKNKKLLVSKKSVKEEQRFLDNPGDLAKLQYADFLNGKLVEELEAIIPKFKSENISFLNEWLIGDEDRSGENKLPGAKKGEININDN